MAEELGKMFEDYSDDDLIYEIKFLYEFIATEVIGKEYSESLRMVAQDVQRKVFDMTTELYIRTQERDSCSQCMERCSDIYYESTKATDIQDVMRLQEEFYEKQEKCELRKNIRKELEEKWNQTDL